MPSHDQLLSFFQALADASRLRIVGLLAVRPHTVDELATVLDLRASTVSHHLSRLTDAGLVTATPRGHYHEYALDVEALHARARTLASPDDVRGLAAVEPGVDPFEQRVLAAFLGPDGRLAGALPMKRKKFDVLLRHALKLFDDEGPWDEREVNRRLLAVADDTASFRRGFVDHRYMARDAAGAAYRRIDRD